MGSFGRELLERHLAGQPIVVPDVARQHRAAEAQSFADIQVGAYVGVPLVKGGRLAAGLTVHAPGPRDWTPAEVSMTEDTAERTWAAVERARAEAALRQNEVRLHLAMEATDLAIYEWDLVSDHLTANERFKEMVGIGEGKPLLGAQILEHVVHPDDRPRIDPDLARAMDGTSDGRFAFEHRLSRTGPLGEPWVLSHGQVTFAGPEHDRRPARVFGTLQSITARKAAEDALREQEERQAFLLRLSDALRPLADPAKVQAAATTLLREQLDAGWCYYVEWNEAGTVARVLRDAAREGLPSLAGEHDVSDVPEFLDLLRTGETLNAPDYARFELLSPRVRGRYADLGFRSMLGVPLVKGRQLVATLLLGDTVIRPWSDIAVALARETAERTWAAVERARAEAALRERDERNAFLVRFSDAVRGLSDPASIEEAACRLLAERLGTERTLWAVVDRVAQAYVTERVIEDGRRVEEPPPWPINPADPFAAEHLDGRSVAYEDAATDPRVPEATRAALSARGMAAGIAVPVFTEGTLHAVLSTSQRAAPRRWRPEEVAFAEALAGRAWAEVERARAEQALRGSEERLRAIVETATDYASLTTDVEGRIETWSQGAEKVLGWSAEEVVGQLIDITFTLEDRAAGAPRQERQRARETGHASDVRWHQRRDGTRVFIEGTARPLLALDGTVAGFVKVGQDVTDRREAEVITALVCVCQIALEALRRRARRHDINQTIFMA
ncbi:GAF domain-containing protein [Rubellimicrobium rubrum]|uniref:GAF domain-containing protein n=1 Tax=Rubellimicrobium rubrum TaxID=2585369 RepID=UPI001FEC7776|nr:GAF domain-containing protein [Rubellimicrobium rubrum]